MPLKFTLNGNQVSLEGVPGEATLLEVLRQRLDMLGAKEGCGVGECGACTVLLDGKAVDSCLTAAWQAAGREVTTVEGLAQGDELHPMQKGFADTGAVQCGFCTPGMILTALDLVEQAPEPSEQQIRRAMSGNLCRCTGYHDVVRGVRRGAKYLRGEGEEQ
ncbi:MAG: (2Fe-2S)-binding protein [Desulfarculaceae bacterium]|nr:(2Fe-2S)-binding protein [Desulfarculaceae bacterium]MCF8047560.1 (2Fe-2S)-binding protein [Desulfarculaceae bacterium]MCF8063853.1 (2Fe-2S)-binding protein [Desulfarculaceae bacterium]MCF8098945.1 (2Fe-2S)-binding protein [Desulfarculaceae bacterium]MCF8122588.1 (2Fe-2S)-binding protein [Desulfarculaceae bacterium]